MELGDRKKKILDIVVSSYIKDGEPVGSKTVADSLGLEISSATIRNEMAALEELGFLHQPHTSAGRVPSVKGYREYVDKIMKYHKLSENDYDAINGFIGKLKGELATLSESFALKASEITGCAAVAITPVSGGVVRMFEAVVAGKRLLAIIAISGSGMVRTKICVTDCDADNEKAAVLTKILNSVFAGVNPEQIGELRLVMLDNEMSKYCPDLKGLLVSVIDLINELKGYDIYVGGESLVLSFPELSNAQKAKNLMNTLHKRDELTKIIFEKPNGGISIDVFAETGENDVKDISMISAGYKFGEQNGFLCAFGPTRLDYARVKAQMDYFVKTLSRLINDNYF